MATGPMGNPVQLALSEEEIKKRNQSALNSGNPGPLAPATPQSKEKGVGEELIDMGKDKALNYADEKATELGKEGFNKIKTSLSKPSVPTQGPLANPMTKVNPSQMGMGGPEVAMAGQGALTGQAATNAAMAVNPATMGMGGAEVAMAGQALGGGAVAGGGAAVAGGGAAAATAPLMASLGPALVGVAAVDQLFNNGKMRKSIFNASGGGEVTPEYYNQGTPQIDMRPENLPYEIEKGKAVGPRGDVNMPETINKPYTIKEGTALDPRNMGNNQTKMDDDPRVILRGLIAEEKTKAQSMPTTKPFDFTKMSPGDISMIKKGRNPYSTNQTGPLA